MINTAVILAEEWRLPEMSVQCMNKQFKCPTSEFPFIMASEDSAPIYSHRVWSNWLIIQVKQIQICHTTAMSVSYITSFCNNTKSSWWKEFIEHQWMCLKPLFETHTLEPSPLDTLLWVEVNIHNVSLWWWVSDIHRSSDCSGRFGYMFCRDHVYVHGKLFLVSLWCLYLVLHNTTSSCGC